MGRVLKPLLVVAAIAVNVIPGVGQVLSAAMISAITTAGITAGLGLAASALGLGPKSPAVSPASRERLYASVDPATPRKFVFGRTALATDIRYQEWNGTNQEYLDEIVCVASHRITSVDELWLDDKLAWSNGVAQGEFAGYLTVQPVLEGNAGNFVVIGNGSKWGANRRMTGLAYLRLRFKVTGNSKKAESPFAQNIPTRRTIVGQAAPVYDPRFDSTRGGSGPMRADDQTTWAYSYGGVACGRNPANQLLTYLLGWRINGKLALGRGVPPSRIDFDAFITAANACDEAVAMASGGSEPRYRSDGLFSEADDPRAIIDTFEATMNAKLRDAGGRFSLAVIANDLATPRFDFDDSDVLNEFRWTPTAEIERAFNEIRGRFTNPSSTALYQLVDYPRYREVPVDGIERVQTMDLPMVQSGSQAQRLAKQQFARNKYQGRFEAQLGVRGWAVQLGDVVTLTFSALGWYKRVFRVVEHGIRPDGVCPIVLQEEHPDIYLWDRDERPVVQPVQLVPYDANKSVLLQLLVAGEIEYADGSSLESLQPAMPDATKGAPSGTNVGGVYNPVTGTTTGGKDAGAVVYDQAQQGLTLDQILLDVDDLQATYGDTASAGAAATAAAAAQAAAETARDVALGYRNASQLAAAAQAAAETARDVALGYRNASQLAATNSDNARALSDAARTASETARDQSQGFATNASGSATSASGSATSAMQYRDTAGQHATAASASSVTAQLQAAAILPATLVQNGAFFTRVGYGTAATATPGNAEVLAPFVVDSAYGPVFTHPNSGEHVGTRGVLPYEAGKAYDMEARVFTASANEPVISLLWVTPLRADFTLPPSLAGGGGIGVGAAAFGVVGSVATLSSRIVLPDLPDAVWLRFGVLLNRKASSAGTDAQADQRFISLAVRDATMAKAAGESATAAATSASAAAISKTDAATAASASSDAKIAAEAARDASSGSASAAAGSASAASGSATSAGNSASSATTQRNQAEAFRNQSSDFAVAASGSALSASGSATSAGQSATAAAGSAATAQTAKGAAEAASATAVQSKTDAAGSASAAAASATLSASSASASGQNLSKMFPRTVSAEAFTSNAGPLESPAIPAVAIVNGSVRLDTFTAPTYPLGLWLRSALPVVPGRTYRLTAVLEWLDGTRPYAQAYAVYQNAAGAYLGEALFGVIVYLLAARTTYEADWTPNLAPAGAATVKLGIVANRQASVGSTVNAVTAVHAMYADDVSPQRSAEGSATASAASASQAAASNTAAGNSATSATTQRNQAEAFRNQADGFATAASGSASSAAGSATAAGTSASAASGSAQLAQTAKGQAEAAQGSSATSASNAAGSANAAASSATLSASSAINAGLAMSKLFPRAISAQAFTWGNQGGADLQRNTPLPDAVVVNGAIYQDTNSVIPGNYPYGIWLRSPAPWVQGVTYRSTARLQQLSGAQSLAFPYLMWFDAFGGYLTETTFASGVVLDGSLKLHTYEYTCGVSYAPPGAAYIKFGYVTQRAVANVAIVQAGITAVHAFFLDDVTAAKAAEGSASASAGSASQAAASNTEAGNSATSATTAKNDAVAARDAASGSASASAGSASSASGSATAAGNSASAANQSKLDAQAANSASAGSASAAAGSAVTANAAAVTAQTNAVLSARIGAAMLNKNPSFADLGYAYDGNGQPLASDWSYWWSTPAAANKVGGGQSSNNRWQMTCAANQVTGIASGLFPLRKGYYVLESIFELGDGVLDGVRIYVSHQQSGVGEVGGTQYFLTDFTEASGITVNNSGLSGYRRILARRLIYLNLPANVDQGALVLMLNFGDTVSYKYMWFDFVGIRPANDAEISTMTALPELQASVSTLSGAVTTLQGRATAYMQQVVNAGASATAFVELRAETSPGSITSSVAIGAREVHIFNQVGGTWSRVLSVSGGNVVVNGSLTASSGIFLGNGALWRVQYAQRTFAVTDGVAVSFGQGVDLGAVPQFTFVGDNLAPLAAGETYRMFADNASGTGFTPRLRIITPGTSTSYSLTVDAAPGTGPTRQIDKAANPDASNNVYTLGMSGNYTGYSYNGDLR